MPTKPTTVNGGNLPQGPTLVLVVAVVVFECNPTRPPGRPTLHHSLPRWRTRLYPLAWYYRPASWVRIPSSAYSYNFSSCCALVDVRKARERELATLDEKWTTSGCWTLCAKKNEDKNREGKGKDDTCDHGLYVQKLESRSVPEKKEITRRDDQSAVSSNKEHVKYEATQTCLSVTYQHTTTCTWPANDHSHGVRDDSNNRARHPTAYLPPSSSGAA